MPPKLGQSRWGKRAWGWILLLVCLPVLSVQAHAPNTSYLRCQVEPHRLDMTFSFDLATLFRVIGYDINASGKVSRTDMEAASQQVYRFIEEAVQLQINGKAVSLGQRQPMGWPVDGGDAIQEQDYQQKLLHFRFLCESQPLIEDITIAYNVFDDFGADHRVVADLQQSGKHLEVVFTQPEPDYLFDTYWRAEPQAAASGAPQNFRRFQEAVSQVWRYPAWLLLVCAAMFMPRRVRSFGIGFVALALAGWAWKVSAGGWEAVLGALSGLVTLWLAALPSLDLLQQLLHRGATPPARRASIAPMA